MTINHHWRHAIVTFLITVLAAGVLLPLVRVQPELVHAHLNELNDWLRYCFTAPAQDWWTAEM